MPSSSPCWTHLKLRDCYNCVLSLCITAASDCPCSCRSVTRGFARYGTPVVLLRSLILEATLGQLNGILLSVFADRRSAACASLFLRTNSGRAISSTVYGGASGFECQFGNAGVCGPRQVHSFLLIVFPTIFEATPLKRLIVTSAGITSAIYGSCKLFN
jgi:hypothetical protein